MDCKFHANTLHSFFFFSSIFVFSCVFYECHWALWFVVIFSFFTHISTCKISGFFFCNIESILMFTFTRNVNMNKITLSITGWKIQTAFFLEECVCVESQCIQITWIDSINSNASVWWFLWFKMNEKAKKRKWLLLQWPQSICFYSLYWSKTRTWFIQWITVCVLLYWVQGWLNMQLKRNATNWRSWVSDLHCRCHFVKWWNFKSAHTKKNNRLQVVGQWERFFFCIHFSLCLTYYGGCVHFSFH